MVTRAEDCIASQECESLYLILILPECFQVHKTRPVVSTYLWSCVYAVRRMSGSSVYE